LQGIQGASGPAGTGVVAGIIVMWGGLVANIPVGWVLCNGLNGTPDLSNRFIKGTSGNPGATGGSATHTHAAHADHAALTHSGATVGNHADVTNHVHGQQLQGSTSGTNAGTHLMGSVSTGGSLRSAGQSTLNPTTVGVAAQVHTVGQAAQHAAQSHSAHDTPNSEPAFYALCFIQKT
jgi:hypothetical protein